MKKNLTLLFLLIFLQSKSQTTFQRIYQNGYLSVSGKGYCISSDGNYVIAGQESDGAISIAALIKVDVLGNIIWRKAYPGVDGFNSIIPTPDGGFAITGLSDSLVQNDFEMCIIKTDSLGIVQWSKLYGLVGVDDNALEIVQTNDGGFAVNGTGINLSSTTFYAYVVKVDSSGNMLWDKFVSASITSGVNTFDISATSDGGVIVTGTYSLNNGLQSNLLLTRIDPSGQIVWSRTYGNDFFGGISLQTNDGGFISSGLRSSPGNQAGFLLMKSDSSGNFQWGKVYSDAINPSPDLIINTDGDYILAGTHQDGVNDSANVYIIKTNTQGDTIWTRFYEIDNQLGYRGESANRIMQVADGGYLVGGHADEIQSGNSDFYLLKTDAGGLAGCNQVYRQITIESVTPIVDAGFTFSNGLTSASIAFSGTLSQISDSLLCLFNLVHEYQDIPLELFPNPAVNEVTVNTLAFEGKELFFEITDLMGRNICQQKINRGASSTIDVSAFSKGVYIIRISGKNETGVEYFVKQ